MCKQGVFMGKARNFKRINTKKYWVINHDKLLLGEKTRFRFLGYATIVTGVQFYSQRGHVLWHKLRKKYCS
jgi:hypothetical protein